MAQDNRDFVYDNESPTDLDQLFRESLLATGCYEEV